MRNHWFAYILLLLSVSCRKEKKTESAAKRMQDFVCNISDYAKNLKQNFIIIPQNGLELIYENADPEKEMKGSYIGCIDGFGVEELFYNSDAVLETNESALSCIRALNRQKPVLVADYCANEDAVNNSNQLNNLEGNISFPRNSSNYDYKEIPGLIANENNNNILSLKEAKNYLYLISNQNFNSREDFLSAVRATNYDVVIIDLFFGDDVFTSEEIQSIQKKANGGKRLVISYINIGAAEKYRYYWKKGWITHIPHWLKKRYKGYKDEVWVKFWNKKWQSIIYGNDNSYIKKIIDAGFDGAYLDNVEAYYFLYNKN